MTLLRVVYDGIVREVEPYSLTFKKRKDGVGQEYFYVYDRTGGRSSDPGIKTFLHGKIQSIENTTEKFTPCHVVDISKSGEYGDDLYFGNQSPYYKTPKRTPARRAKTKKTGWVYVVECSYCSRHFTHSTRTTALRQHKDKYGNRCYGKRGTIVDQRYGTA